VLDRVNVPALVEIAGEDPCGFVEVVHENGRRISTTRRRADVLTRDKRWTEVSA
jgi:hypothetical protein